MLKALIHRNKDKIKSHYKKCLGFFQEMDILEMKQGNFYVQTTDLSETEAITTFELFLARDKDVHLMTLIGREREGADHDSMRSYDRDTELPLWSKVRVR